VNNTRPKKWPFGGPLGHGGFLSPQAGSHPLRSAYFETTCESRIRTLTVRRACPKVAQSGAIQDIFPASVHWCTRTAFQSLFVILGVRGSCRALGSARLLPSSWECEAPAELLGVRGSCRASLGCDSAGASSSRNRATRLRIRDIGCWSSGIGCRTSIGTVRGSRWSRTCDLRSWISVRWPVANWTGIRHPAARQD